MVVVRTVVEPPRRSGEEGVELSLLVLSVSALGLMAVDLGSGAIVRAKGLDGLRLRPYTVVRARLAAGAEPLDPTQPEAVVLDGAPTPRHRLAPRRADRWLRPLLHPERSHLLGFAGPSIPFWELDGSRPSVAIVAAPAQVRRAGDGLLRCRFLWRTLVHDLPFVVEGETAVPNEAGRVLVALTPPIEGHCYKVVTGLL